MEIETVLVPVDGSGEAITAVEYGVELADAYGAGLHALYVFGEGLVRGVEAGDVEERQVAAESEAFMSDVRDLAGDVQVSHATAAGFSLSRLAHHPGSVILDAADDVDADLLVVPREPAAEAPASVLEKAAEYVLAHATQPVLSV